ncbi:MAG TPA: glycosyltransferase [Pyrinomonadaceae bacterium]|jgi:glycosyltransferase involved in cell wall biosynthesis
MQVSVLITTYNHEAYISQAIESVLQQQVDFDYEIVIGEDASTDRTREIVSAFQRQYPDKIRGLYRDPQDAQRARALGVSGKDNFVNALRDCRGKYIAMLDGDDYWVDPLKLQKQVDFLELHPDFAISFHDVLISYEDGRPSETFQPPDQKEVLTIENLFSDNPIHYCSAVYRNKIFEPLPDWFFEVKPGDWVIHIINARTGKIRYFKDIMATYRVRSAAYWQGRPRVEQILEIINTFNYLHGYLEPKYEDKLRRSEGEWQKQLAWAYYEAGKRREARQALSKYFVLCERNPRIKQSLTFLRDEAPALYELLRQFKNVFSPRSQKKSSFNSARRQHSMKDPARAAFAARDPQDSGEGRLNS